MNYSIFTDSSSGLPKTITNQFDINIIPLTCIINGEETPIKCDDEDFLKEFYENLRNKADMTTACINEQTFCDYFSKELENGNDVIYIGLSSGLSTTIQNAISAKTKLEQEFKNNKVYIVDSLNACLGEGLLVYTACVKKELGFTIEALYEYLKSITLKANSLFTVKTLTYLAKGGRISKVSMVLGGAMDIKPVMHVNELGKLVASRKVIGRKRSIMALADDFIKMVENPEEQTIFIGHGDCIQDAEYLASLIKAKIAVKNVVFNYIDPVIAIHSGPDTLAVFAYGETRKN